MDLTSLNFNQLLQYFDIVDFSEPEIINKTNLFIQDANSNHDSKLATRYKRIQNILINGVRSMTESPPNNTTDSDSNSDSEESNIDINMMFDFFSDYDDDKDDIVLRNENENDDDVDSNIQNESEDSASDSESESESENKFDNDNDEHNYGDNGGDGDSDGDSDGDGDGDGADSNDVFISDIQKGLLNPITNKTEKKFIVIDTQYIHDVNKSDFTINLSENLKRVISIKLHSFFIPRHWYNINNAKNNNSFVISYTDEDGYPQDETITISEGNYSVTDMIFEINSILSNLFPDMDVVYLNSKTGKITFDFQNTNIYKISFWSSSSNGSFKNLTLGWLLGFRQDFISETTTAHSFPNLMGAKYIYIVVDDFKRNRVSNNIVTPAMFNNNNKIPSYYTADIPRDSVTYDALPTIPRTLTDAQLYTINNIALTNKKNNLNNNTFLTPPSCTDILAVIPIKQFYNSFDDVFVEMSGSLQDNKRDYNGPVDLHRLHIKLVDDTGFVLDLNGSDWSLNLIYEYIYHF